MASEKTSVMAEAKALRLREALRETERAFVELEKRERGISNCEDCPYYSGGGCEIVFFENCPLGEEHIRKVTGGAEDRFKLEKAIEMFKKE